jgi:DNA-directed RNA polymerase subunit RPC12/RpoP
VTPEYFSPASAEWKGMGSDMFFLPYTPEEVVEETEKILEIQRRENKSPTWVFNELIAWEDRNKGRVFPVYGMYYHVASQAKRVADQDILPEEMREDLEDLFRKYWSPQLVLWRFLAGIGKILGMVLLFLLVAVAHYGLSRLVGNALAASIIIGILAAIVLVPEGARGLWTWYTKRVDSMYAVYQRSLAQRLGGLLAFRCPGCGRDVGNIVPDKDGFIECECGYRINRKPGSPEKG